MTSDEYRDIKVQETITPDDIWEQRGDNVLNMVLISKLWIMAGVDMDIGTIS